MTTARAHRRMAARHRAGGDDGGVWIITGIVCGVILYGFIVLMDVAGFTPVLPLVVIPPVLVAMIGANSLLGGGRRPARAPVPLDGDRPAPGSHGSDGATAGGSNGSVAGGAALPPVGDPPAEGPPGAR